MYFFNPYNFSQNPAWYNWEMTRYKQRLNHIVNILKEFNPEMVYAYGSWVWGKSKKDSDIDLMVVVKKGADTLKISQDIESKLFNSGYPYDLEPDIHVVEEDTFNYRLSKGDPFVSDVAKGKLIYTL